MQLTFNLEYFGNCRDALDFYSSVFELASIWVRTFREMDMAQTLGITKTGLDLVWQADLSIPSTGNILSFEMADSMMAAMQMDSGIHRPRPCPCPPDAGFRAALCWGKVKPAARCRNGWEGLWKFD